MKKIFGILWFIICSFVFTQTQHIVINNKKYSVENFKKRYKNNIEVLGIKSALNDFIEYELMLQKAEEKKVDTTYYFKALYNQNIAKYTNSFYDSLVSSELKKYKVSIDSLNKNEKKEVLNNLLLDKNYKNLKVDSMALVEVNKFYGDDFFKKEKVSKFKGDKIIFSTPTGKFTQADYYDVLLIAKNQVNKELSLSDFIKQAYGYIQMKFLLDDIRANMATYYPNYKKKSDELRRAILINYFIEKYIYHEADNDHTGREVYLKENAERYTWPVRYEMNIYRYQTDEDANQIIKWLKEGKSEEYIKQQFQEKFIKNAPRLIFISGKLPLSHSDLGKINTNVKIQKSTFKKTPAIIQIIKKIPSKQMSIEEAGEIFRDDYRSFYFNKALSNLKKEAIVIIPEGLESSKN